ncbi:MAG: dNTP triphosphohydrolase, broad substrate specificity [Nitrospira sp.]|jgi:HD superfamily phosphohydrolase|nr:MAG: dNTP triphosphohydrolase, broad substrate specificity [Nitrospira sp.]
MKLPPVNPPAPYDGSALIADPIHEYVSFTVPYATPDPSERTEKDLIDSPWVQRLRYIYQLQSARWVYPSAEHTRFVHSLGTMHVAGRFARHLYPFLKTIAPDVPSAAFVEEFLRVTALVHDIGHGPFCHFFDDNYLHGFGLSHERLGQIIIREHLGPLIRKVRRGPSGPFDRGEELNPDLIAHVILKEKGKDNSRLPRWLNILQPVISGSYTADNLDYVLRDAYMCGVAVGPVDLTRLIHYTIVTDKGFTIHKTGLPALQMFLNTRMYLYSNVYYHRTTRAIDIHLRDIFGDTMKLLFPDNPARHMDKYLTLTDWSLLEDVRGWKKAGRSNLRRLHQEWAHILGRDVKWKMAYSTVLKEKGVERGMDFPGHEQFQQQIRKALPTNLQTLPFRVDMAPLDPRPDPKDTRGIPLYVYDPGTKGVSIEPLEEFLDLLPTRLVQFRLYALDHEQDAALSRAAATVLNKTPSSMETNF